MRLRVPRRARYPTRKEKPKRTILLAVIVLLLAIIALFALKPKRVVEEPVNEPVQGVETTPAKPSKKLVPPKPIKIIPENPEESNIDEPQDISSSNPDVSCNEDSITSDSEVL